MSLVAGVDSSTQACKIVIRDSDTGELIREGRATHPAGTSIDPAAWWDALQTALGAAGGLDDVAAISIAAQQHGMVCLEDNGDVVRPALLWNDTRSAESSTDLIAELGGPQAWADAVGSVPLAAFTVTKLRWLAEHEPVNAARTAAVCLPHDWLTWRLQGSNDINALVTDRSDASGTGYWSPAVGDYRPDLVRRALGHDVVVPQVLDPQASAGYIGRRVLGAGCGDNAAAALGVDARLGDVIVSIGTSGVVSAVTASPTADPSGVVAGFASATGDFLPLACTLNAARVIDTTAELLGVSHVELDALATAAPGGSDGLVLVPYFDGERTPNRPHATAALHGLTMQTMSREHLARAAVEGMLCGLAAGLDALRAHGVAPRRIILIGGGAQSRAVRELAPGILGNDVDVPSAGEYVANGAARQAAWVLSGNAEPPHWSLGPTTHYTGEPTPGLRERYAEARELTIDRQIQLDAQIVAP